MAASKQRAKEIKKRAMEVGAYETGIEYGLSEESVRRYVRIAEEKECCGTCHKPKEDGPILVIPDTHIPYHHKDMIPFLLWVQEVYQCRERVVHVGDLMDFHSMSFHKSEPDAMSPEDEYELALEIVGDFCEAFPYGDMVEGNHDKIAERKLVDSSVAPSMLKTPRERYGLTEGWNVHSLYYVIEEWNVLVEHGLGSSGKYGCANTAKEKRCSYVQGHTHSNAAVIYSSNYRDTIFGMNVGCLADDTSLAMRYGKYTTRKGILGCGVIYSGEHAEFVPISAYLNKGEG